MRAAWLAVLLVPAAGAARADSPMLGCNMPAWWNDAYDTPAARESLRRLAATGATWVALTPTVYAMERTSSEVFVTAATPTDASLRSAIRAAHARGLKVLLKPHVDPLQSYPRFVLSPKDPELWFRSYGVQMRRYAVLAREEGVEMLAVGTELALLAHSGHRARWLRLIADVRARYPGPLTYAADSQAVHFTSFWDKLDYIGVDAYFPVVGGTDVSALRAGWRPWIAVVAAAATLYGKPVIFTEWGITSQSGANLRPWDWGEFGALDLEIQTAGYEAMIAAVKGEPWLKGYFCWAWSVAPNSGGRADRSHTVNGKPAQAVLERAFAAAKRPPPPAPQGLIERLERVARSLAGLPGKIF